ncbi:uncharacterized protein G2W53_009506 [Senna tora]|uniref:Uncharacterized protein n=1 Tax=Senna tora TaxID=362788 RepID=A0A835CCP0_9FABA|nr:uncharacterized protein G2W53_009506 [Senna tora]
MLGESKRNRECEDMNANPEEQRISYVSRLASSMGYVNFCGIVQWAEV